MATVIRRVLDAVEVHALPVVLVLVAAGVLS